MAQRTRAPWAEAAATLSCGHLAQTSDALPFCQLLKNVEQPKKTSFEVLKLNSTKNHFFVSPFFVTEDN